jgi:hypothetical protein
MCGDGLVIDDDEPFDLLGVDSVIVPFLVVMVVGECDLDEMPDRAGEGAVFCCREIAQAVLERARETDR